MMKIKSRLLENTWEFERTNAKGKSRSQKCVKGHTHDTYCLFLNRDHRGRTLESPSTIISMSLEHNAHRWNAPCKDESDSLLWWKQWTHSDREFTATYSFIAHTMYSTLYIYLFLDAEIVKIFARCKATRVPFYDISSIEYSSSFRC